RSSARLTAAALAAWTSAYTSARCTWTLRGASIPRRTVSPRTSSTTTRTSSPMTMLSPVRRVRTSTAGSLPGTGALPGAGEPPSGPRGRPSSDGGAYRPVRPGQDHLGRRPGPGVDDDRCQEVSGGRARIRPNREHHEHQRVAGLGQAELVA